MSQKKILVISASPRKGGNSDTLCDEFIRGATEAGHAATKIFLRDKTIHYCTGCGLCNEHQGRCSQKDDMAGLLDALVAADAIVLSTPVYFYTMNAQLKTFIDRTCARYTEISHKDFYFILTAADGDEASLERTVEGLRGFTEACLEGARERGIVYGAGVWKVGLVQATKAMREAYDLGKNA